ncbi:uncharacterized protein [Tenebrio molitor]|uniref:uncharacterized protein isoform X2 n=1 Tax=Tenebrio molitor TaxID=7067 RepID=UPI0036247964
MCYTEFSIVVHLSKNHLVEQAMEVIDLWKIDSAGEETKQRITKESRRINMFVAINTILAVVVVSHNPTETVFVRDIFHLLFPSQAKFHTVFFNLMFYLAVLATMAHPYQVIYTTQHVKFQIYMCKTFIQKMTDRTDLEEILLYDGDYQESTESRLKFLINRHCDFIRGLPHVFLALYQITLFCHRCRDNALLQMKNFIVPFTLGAVVITTSFALSLLQDAISWRSCLMAVCALLTITSLITAGHTLEDESEKMLASFSIPKWYTWNIKNKKLLLTILTNTTRPINLKFTDSFTINYTILVFIAKALYSILSVFLSTKIRKD